MLVIFLTSCATGDTSCSVESHSERVLIVKLVLVVQYILLIYRMNKRNSEMIFFQMVSCILEAEMAVIAGDMNGNVESGDVGAKLHGI